MERSSCALHRIIRLPNIDIRLLSEFYSYIEEEEILEKVGSRGRRTPPQEREQITRSVVGRPKKQPR